MDCGQASAVTLLGADRVLPGCAPASSRAANGGFKLESARQLMRRRRGLKALSWRTSPVHN